MGFFSWDCKGCDNSVREGRGWMGQAVVVTSEGDINSGSYDGYGGLGLISNLGDHGDNFALWHEKCFALSGRPSFATPSRSARDQGMPPADEYPEPKVVDDLRALKELAGAKRRKEREAAQKARQEYVASLIAKGEPVPEYLKASK